MSPSSDDSRPSASAAGKPTLETLLRLKRAERPDAAFWSEFERGFRQKQLAASIEPRPWWLGLALFGRRLAPLGLPASAGAAALLAVVALRTQAPFAAAPDAFEPETVARVAGSPAPALAAAASPTIAATSAPAADAPLASPTSFSAPALELVSAPAPAPVRTPAAPSLDAPAAAPGRTLDLPVVATLLELPSLAAALPTPSQRTIAENLAAVRAEQPELIAAAPTLAALEPEREKPAAPERAVNPRQARLLAMADTAAAHSSDLASVRERMAHRLAHDDTRYGSSSRLAAAGDRFSLSF